MENRAGHDTDAMRKVYYKRLFRKFVILTVVISLIPLLLIGWIINYHYSSFAENRTKDSFRTQLEQHRKLVDLFIQEQVSKLNLVAQVNTKDFLADRANLLRVFANINEKQGAFTDLGLIDGYGDHLAYIGPYDLINKNYSQSFWFQEIITGDNKRVYVSDMFMGFREVPHFVIAVLRSEGDQKWILRATIETDVFRSIVEDVRIGSTGEVFMLNEQGVYQTNPGQGGKIMEKSSFPVMPYDESLKIQVRRFGISSDHTRPPMQIAAYTWLTNPRWMLVIRQNLSEALYDVNHANYIVLIFLHISALIILAVTILITRYMINVIRMRDADVEHANKKFIHASKLASVGELSAGVAHEINNPLAIILSEKQILVDMEQQTDEMASDFREQLLKSLSRISNQVQRCKRLTHNLLRFSRRTQSVIGDVDISTLIEEVTELVEREAATSGVRLIMELDPDLPTILTDSSQVQQVLLNLITNAIDAHDGKPYGRVQVVARFNKEAHGVDIVISDTGSGISPEIVDKIFDPFFTTKAVGKGTGLGLSICYGILRKLHGNISVQSEYGAGAVFTVFLPLELPGEVKGNVEEETR